MRHEICRSYLLASALTTATLLSASGAQAQAASAQSLAELEQQLQADLKAVQQEEQLIMEDMRAAQQQNRGGKGSTGTTTTSTGTETLTIHGHTYTETNGVWTRSTGTGTGTAPVSKWMQQRLNQLAARFCTGSSTGTSKHGISCTTGTPAPTPCQRRRESAHRRRRGPSDALSGRPCWRVVGMTRPSA